ncbi:MAG: hypothetical protein ACRC46_08145 [Thermoguttaceae bacterium]
MTTITRRDFCLTCGAAVGAGVLGGGGSVITAAAAQDSHNVLLPPRQFWKINLAALSTRRSRSEKAIFERIAAESSRDVEVVLLLAGQGWVVSSRRNRVVAAAEERRWTCWIERLMMPSSDSYSSLQVVRGSAYPAGLVSLTQTEAGTSRNATGLAYDNVAYLLDHRRGQWDCFALDSPYDAETFVSETRLAIARRIDASLA